MNDTSMLPAEAGAAVALADMNEKAVHAAAQELVATGHKAICIGCNVADEGEVAAMVDQTVSAFGRLDAALNIAGYNLLPSKWPMSPARNLSA
jgi:NAD(P)-dependent dehydrogenase (short-subunit alcohol dehydrogenase family)